MGGTERAAASIAASAGYERVPRESPAWWQLSDFELIAGVMGSLMPATLLAMEVAMREVTPLVGVPAILAVAAGCFVAAATVARVSEGRTRAKRATEAATGKNSSLLASLVAGNDPYEAVLGMDVDERYGLADAWMNSADLASGAAAAEGGDAAGAIDMGAYDTILSFSDEYGRWLVAGGYRNNTDANPFRYVLGRRGNLLS